MIYSIVFFGGRDELVLDHLIALLVSLHIIHSITAHKYTTHEY